MKTLYRFTLPLAILLCIILWGVVGYIVWNIVNKFW